MFKILQRVLISAKPQLYTIKTTVYQSINHNMYSTLLITNKTSWLSQSGNTIVSGYHFYDLGY